MMGRSSMGSQLTGNRKKPATKKGKQVAAQPKKVAKKTAKYRKA